MRWQNMVTIDAPVQRVWELTVDVESWPSYTPTMQSVTRLDSGPIRVGSSAQVKQPAQRPKVWTVTRLVEGREFTWHTKLGWLTMTGSHLLEPVGQGCRNTLVLELTGFGARMFGALIGGAIAKSLAAENAGFRAAATATVAP
jgi:uncharacterized membrane protein